MNAFCFFLAAYLYSIQATQATRQQWTIVAPKDTIPATYSPNFPTIGQFQQPQQLASALATTGLGPFSDWDYVGDYWGASTAEYEFGAAGIKGRKNTLAFQLESTEGNFVKTLKLVLTLNNPAERKAALSLYTSLAQKALHTINVAVPIGLTEALQQGKSVSYEDRILIIKNLYQDGVIGFYTLEITTL